MYLFTTGDGKTHFVKRMLQEKVEYPSVTITVNEGFTTTCAILELNSLTEDAKSPIVFFNFTFTLLPSDYKVRATPSCFVPLTWCSFEITSACFSGL